MRERILEGAAQLFDERGIAETSTNRIAAHVGVSIGSLYRYFADKDEIVAALRTRFTTELEERFTAAVLTGLSMETQAAVATGIGVIVDTLAEHRGLVRALAGQSTIDGLAFDDLERRLLVLTRAYLLHQLGALSDEILDARAFVMVSVGLATSIRIGLSPPAGVERQLLVDETARMLAVWISAG
ncbi:TetR/AcrR family transcriptional regulator [Antrihabitans sp. YC2-6]|uniref:TetR/AcrR family transcriptional regulator n=1 Tax=Antrihabitans sp. YC2-6 TaxID=2799498 RepID=UPI0018F5273F|nr:TetR/AcrR family transcriptional regulator [Antrihabitans sp. YC2-6]MBJ8345007.1 TetR/AcrR family transcriptional regulator [Antrihabitans sp. YC2-6]